VHQLDTASLTSALAQLATQIAQLTAAHQTTGALYSALVSREQQLQSFEALEASNATLVQPATVASQVRPRLLRNIVLALLLGAVLGMTLMVLRDATDTHLRTEREMRSLLDLSMIGRVSPPRRATSNIADAVVHDPSTPLAEQFRVLRANVELAALSLKQCRTLLVTSAHPSEGKSTTAASLAITWARLGRRVALLDLDLRRPMLARMLDVSVKFGLTDLVRGDAALSDALIDVPLEASHDRQSSPASQRAGSVHLLAPGSQPLNVGDFLALDAVHNIIKRIATSDHYDYVLIDTPPMVAFADALTLAPSADAFLLVARLNVLTRPAAREVRRILASLPTPCIGFVLTGARDRQAGYGYHYGYGNDSGFAAARQLST